MKTDKLVTFNFRVPESLKAEFLEVAEQDHMSQTEAIKQAMREFIEKRKK